MQADNEINLLDALRVVWRRRAFIVLFTFACALGAAIITLFMTDLYRASAILTPVNGKEKIGGELSLIAQQIGGLSGITLPSSGSSSEIISLLNSNILKEKVIKDYDLLPVLFPEQWDREKKAWKTPDKSFFRLPAISGLLTGLFRPAESPANAQGPTVWDGIRRLGEMTKVSASAKDNTITLMIEFHDPELAAKLTERFLTALTMHMSGEAKRVAEVNRRYLVEQLGNSTDPIIRQKIYNLIAQQVEVFMMSEVKENFAFKVIDPPRAADRRVWPRRSSIVELAFAAAFLAASFGAFAIDYVQNRLRKDGGRCCVEASEGRESNELKYTGRDADEHT
ncbi:MAG: hypothetical protein HY891_09565 [Deltaproteobacteria bacterium]|nr:hypothetical protein [Deltaproteobacteria bacterium]